MSSYPFSEAQIREALTVKCPLCKAEPGCECVFLTSGEPYRNRIHYARLEIRQ